MTEKIITYPSIQHLVISGGGIFGALAYGALKKTGHAGFWDIEHIRTIHSVSAGGIVAVMLMLKYDWETLDDYIIKRPWGNVFKYDIHAIFSAFEKRGMFGPKIMEDIMKPLLLGKDLELNITMKEFYEKTHIDLYLYATETSEFQLVSISHFTHPHWKLLDAMYASAGLPGLVAPFLTEDKCYVDGGVFLNYPLKPCLALENVQAEHVFGIQKECTYSACDEISDSSNLFDYIMILLNKTLSRINQDIDNNDLIPHEINIQASAISAADLYKFAISEECRRNWVEDGSKLGERFLAKYVDTPITSESDPQTASDCCL
jgi:predicted acylesterase/phospholipase RssA